MTGCSKCDDMLDREGWALVAACASVGIEFKRSAGEMLRGYLRAFHDGGHREA